MTAAVPDPFRDQLAEEIGGWPLGSGYYQYTATIEDAREMVDALLPLIAARVEAERQAAGNQRAAEGGRVWVRLPVEDVEFLRGFDPDRDRSASRADMVRVVEHLQAVLGDS